MAEVARVLVSVVLAAVMMRYVVRQVGKPTGWLGRLIVRIMNRSHSGLTAWGLEHVQVSSRDAVLDVGCGGGQTVRTLATMARFGKVYGVDYADASITTSQAFNRDAVQTGLVEIHKATVSHLPFPNDLFDLVTAVETHYYWPDLPGDMREIYRVLKPGGLVLMIAEAYRSGESSSVNQLGMKLIGGACLTPDDHRDLFVKTGYADAEVFLNPGKGWICATGRKPC